MNRFLFWFIIVSALGGSLIVWYGSNQMKDSYGRIIQPDGPRPETPKQQKTFE